MRVIIYKGKFQYDVVTDFAVSIGEELEKHGVEVVYIDLEDPNYQSLLLEQFKKPIDFVIGFNGIGYNLTYANQSLYDYVNTAYVMWLVDHPVHIMSRLKNNINNKIIVCIDSTHVDYIEKYVDENRVVTFLPHAVGAIPLQSNIEKKYDVTFAGHIGNTEEFANDIVKLENIIPKFRTLLDKIILEKGNVDLGSFLEELKQQYPLVNEFLKNDEQLKNQMLYIIDRYIRASKRNYIIDYLLDRGVNVNFFGNISENHPFLKSPYFINNGVVSFHEMKTIFQQSKFVLNVLPNFPNGGHERIFTSMMCGAIPISDSNEYIEQSLPHIVSFEIDKIDVGLNAMNSLLNDDKLYIEKVAMNYKNVCEAHTWFNRLNELLYVVHTAKQYWRSRV